MCTIFRDYTLRKDDKCIVLMDYWDLAGGDAGLSFKKELPLELGNILITDVRYLIPKRCISYNRKNISVSIEFEFNGIKNDEYELREGYICSNDTGITEAEVQMEGPDESIEVLTADLEKISKKVLYGLFKKSVVLNKVYPELMEKRRKDIEGRIEIFKSLETLIN